MTTMTVAQALMTFLSRQYTVDGDIRQRTIAGTFGIFGHGNVAGIGQALRQLGHEDPTAMPYHQGRNEQAMVHQAVGYARMNRRRSTYAAAASVGPGAANMLTGAALATANRMPVLLLPSDTFATRVADPVLQQLEHPHDTSLQVTDAFRPLSRFFDRVDRPEQLYSVALAAMRVLTDPAETGAVTIALPEDVQAETIDVSEEFLTERDWHIRRPLPEPGPLDRAVEAIRNAQEPLIIAGGGVLYSDAEDELKAFAEATGIPVATTQAGGGVLDHDHPLNLGGVGATGSAAANRIAASADVIIGVGTRYSDFTTSSRTAFAHPEASFVNLNVASFDAYKHGSRYPIVADARAGLLGLGERLGGFRVSAAHSRKFETERAGWVAEVDASTALTDAELPGQPEIIGAVNRATGARDVVVQAAGSLPGDLQKLWRTRDALGYHVEYAFSCMGYEIAGGLGVRRAIDAADDDRDVVVMVGDGSYLMLHTELVTAVAEGLKLIVVLVQNHGYASIGHLSETVGAPRFGTWYRKYDGESPEFRTDEILPVDLAANARSYGIDVVEIDPGPSASTHLAEAVEAARAAETSTLIHINSDPLVYAPDGEGWWDVPVAAASTMSETQDARAAYEEERSTQRPLL
ncbi:3D-(3,5/4)-trihydroxycyclohexane-1,2-dione acylhydrolase (decyclizing) [Brevibacterium sediminis]|uniref:3D-(3,5/4)-trihydroxycyclohexane-1,2-dione acylhydrolase (Decyclizing) n=1 Tax=Brevibacterium sediminis TaxID=1857024 RepID=A0A5C4X312_9MICO|nr:3D-(3,5/4)-trihydroxycyclohexane-1,2-dione acylhydrolase (decyclizing) [Brevibacterium sediminis]TNM55834.1 3D-(3,5/4)-trihydroxycyclohexane-1,2-dione acylhydrolase (decyclizing) [Brevibacterium sediminis]